jgi:hypothetical protein
MPHEKLFRYGIARFDSGHLRVGYCAFGGHPRFCWAPLHLPGESFPGPLRSISLISSIEKGGSRRWITAWQVCAHWPQIVDRVQQILRPYLCDWDDMVNVKVSVHCFAIVGLEVETTSGATPAIMSETRLPSSPVPLVCVHENFTSRPPGYSMSRGSSSAAK